MKHIYPIILGILPLYTVVSCKKTTIPLTPLASLNVVNAVTGLGQVEANFSSSSGKESPQNYSDISITVDFGFNNLYPVLAGANVGLTIVPVADTTKPVYSGNLNLTNGGIYSLFLTGQPGAIESVYTRDTIPSYADSSCGVRFINLSPGSLPVNVILDPSPATNEFTGIAYKQITGFRKYSTNAANASYTFDVFDAESDSLLASYALTTPVFHNVTLALIGTASAGLSITLINNY